MSRLTEDQALATNPEHSVFVGASAGTGKTHVLTARVLRMMVTGTPPENILCLTYTKAAAANMANRIYEILGKWALLKDQKLPASINALTGEKPDQEMIDRARTLFATVLDIPGGLKIQTIHSFCQSLLMRFPLEAGLAPHFTVMDERTAEDYLKEAAETVMDQAGQPGRSGLKEAFELLSRRTTEEGFNSILKTFLGKRAEILEALRKRGGPEGLIKATDRALGIGPEETGETLLTQALDPKNLDLRGLEKMRDVLLQGSAREIPRGKDLKNFFENLNHPAVAFEDLRAFFFTTGGNPRKPFFVRSTQEEYPEFLEIFKSAQTWLIQICEKMAVLKAAENTRALIRLGSTVLYLYREMKARQGYLDYDDLILFTAGLLEREGIAPWILYKLDNRIDHILVDEAQDTNKIQWALVETLAEEFFAGLGGREELIRTVFAVGDIKQSIYGFQGAEPEEFYLARERIRIKAEQAGLEFYVHDLMKSFRSTQVVLDIVDEVFSLEHAQNGIREENETIRHIANRVGMAGLVEVWPPEVPDRDEEKPKGWKLPFQQTFRTRPETKLAEKIAAHIENLVREGEKLKARKRPVRYGDIMVLVQKREPFMDHLIRELKERQIPVTGSDRMVLSEQIAIQDLITLGRFALLPEDDFSLAVVLKCPLIGLDDDDLMALCIDRKGPLWKELTGSRTYSGQAAYLREILAMADQVTPFQFFSEILGRLEGRKAFIARLGLEVNDPLDEFLSLCLDFERLSTPSLQKFLHWFSAGETKIKRDMERGADEVRIMTVHGAKGLEAPIVYLPDTFRTQKKRTDTLLEVEDGILVWPEKVENEKGPLEAARERFERQEDAERNRLLYVALTRAEDRLYISGWRGPSEPKDPTWYSTIRTALENMEGVEKISGPNGKTLHLESSQEAPPAPADEELVKGPGENPLPGWARRPPETTEVGFEALQPSKAEGGLAVVPGEFDQGREYAIRKGTVIHKLLEVLPEVAPEKRPSILARYLKNPAHALDAADQKDISEKIMVILNDPEFGALFSPKSRAELSLAGVINGKLATGQVDRVVISGDEILIVDYKSNHNVPKRPQEVPAAYKRQLALYSGLLAEVYPGRKIRAALLWTETGELMKIADKDLKNFAS